MWAPTFWALDQIGTLYLVSFWVMKSFVVLCERTCLRGSWFPFFLHFLFDVYFSLWKFGCETGNFFVFVDPFELFSGSLLLSEPGCFTLKYWVFRVNKKLRLPEKLKISVFSIQVHWVFCWPEKKTQGSAHLKKNPCLTVKYPPGRVYIKKKQNLENSFLKTRPYTRTTKNFSLPRKRQEQTILNRQRFFLSVYQFLN